MAKAKEGDIFVMDVEGTDSRERGDEMAVRNQSRDECGVSD